MQQFGVPAERAAEFDAMAEHLSFLSQTTTRPRGTTVMSTEGFEAEDVDFSSAKWMAQVGAVQAWLRFPAPLPLRDPVATLEALVDWLRVDADPATVDDILDALNSYVSRARQLAEPFVVDVEENEISIDVATRRWNESWDEADAIAEDEVEPRPLVAEADIWSINEFSSRAADNELNLTPSYQRSDVWPLADRQLLIQSILRGIPLPSVILLEPEEANKPYEVVDGKQRLTTILRFIGKHPEALKIVKERAANDPELGLLELFETDYPKFAKTWKAAYGETLTSSLEATYYFPFKLPSSTKGLPPSLHRLAGKYYTQIAPEVIEVSNSSTTVRGLFERTGKYKVPLIRYSQASQRQIHEVFNLYNKQGKHLNAEEIRNAIYHELELTRASLLVAGDADRTFAAAIAPSLASRWPDLTDVGSNLTNFGFGTSRYKRTKVLMWVSALLIFDARTDDGGVRRLSTAQHINTLLGRIQDDPSDRLRDPESLQMLFVTLANAIASHQSSLAWSSKFKGSKWQELQLVASLVAIAAAVATHPENYDDVFEEYGSAIYEASDSVRLARPSKTQTNVQWNYVARIVTDLLDAMGIAPSDAATAVEKQFGSTGLHALIALAAQLPHGAVTS